MVYTKKKCDKEKCCGEKCEETKKVKEKIYAIRIYSELTYLIALDMLRELGLTTWKNGKNTEKEPLVRQRKKNEEDGTPMSLVGFEKQDRIIFVNDHQESALGCDCEEHEGELIILEIEPTVEDVRTLISGDVLKDDEGDTYTVVNVCLDDTDDEDPDGIIVIRDEEGEINVYTQTEIDEHDREVVSAERPILKGKPETESDPSSLKGIVGLIKSIITKGKSL